MNKRQLLNTFIYGIAMGLLQLPLWVYIGTGVAIWAGYAYAERRTLPKWRSRIDNAETTAQLRDLWTK
jgi:hypothetical protein